MTKARWPLYLALALVVLWTTRAGAAVWQFSAPIGEAGARAHLFVPPQCEHLRGAIIALDNLLEKPLLEDPIIREAAEEGSLAIIWIAADATGQRPFDHGFHLEAGDGEILESILSGLAEKSGYAELAAIPLLPLGHSAGVPFAVDLAYAEPSRVIAVVDFKSVLPPRPKDPGASLEGIPLLIIKGQFEEWAKPLALTDREASWRSQRGAALDLRRRSGRNLVGFGLDAGGGHFETNPELTRLLALFIRKAAQARLTAEGALKAISPESGCLTDSAAAIEDAPPAIAAYGDFAGEKSKAFWYFDRELAEAARNFGAKQRGKAPQFVTFSLDGQPAPLAPRGTVEIELHPGEDGRSFQVEPGAFRKTPPGLLGEGSTLSPVSGRGRVEIIRGPAVASAAGGFRIQFDRGGFSWRGGDLWLASIHEGDGKHRRAVQIGHMAIPTQNTRGPVQHISFPAIADQPSATTEIELHAVSDSGLPVEYYVLSGPAELVAGKLRFTQVPARARWPVDVSVVAYQWGRTVEPFFQSAEPVTQTFRIIKPASPKPFAHPGMTIDRAELDIIKAKVEAGQEPWKSAWTALLKSPYAALTWRARPRADVLRDPKTGWAGAHELGDDGIAAYTHALIWAVTGDPAHARKSAEILNAWSHSLQSIGGHDAKLLGGLAGYKLCNAAELLKHTDAEWPEAEQQQFRKMLMTVFYPLIHDFFPRANGNWDASMIVTTMCIGVFCDDKAIFERPRDYALHGEGHGAIANYVMPSGQCQESTRDQSHTQLGLGMLADACEVAWKQGDDLWSAYDNRLATGIEYTARYNLGLEVPAEGKISAIGRGEFRPIYEEYYHHYHDLRGLELPYTAQIIAKIRPETVHWDHLPWGTLTHAQANLR